MPFFVLASWLASRFARVSVRPPRGTDTEERAAPICDVRTPSKRETPFVMSGKPVVTASGESFPGYSVTVTPEMAGLHTVVARMEIAGQTISSDAASVFVKPVAREMSRRPVNVPLLKRLSSASRGRFFEDPAAMDRTLSKLRLQHLEEERIEQRSLWQRPLVIVCMLLLLIVEWCVRRWRSLP